MPHAVTWFDISSSNPFDLAEFYEKAFGWKVDPKMMMIQAEKDGNQQGIAGSLSEAHNGAGGVTVYVTCRDIEAHLEKVKAAGGTPLMAKVDLPEGMGSIATFSDPEGNTIGLWAPGAATKETKKAAKKAAKKADKKAAKKAAKKADKKADKKAAKAKKKKPRK